MDFFFKRSKTYYNDIYLGLIFLKVSGEIQKACFLGHPPKVSLPNVLFHCCRTIWNSPRSSLLNLSESL